MNDELRKGKKMERKETLTDIRAEKCVECIKKIRLLLCSPSNLGRDTREAAYKMIESIDEMKRTGLHNGAEDLDKVRHRLTEIIRLTNMFEAGDLIIKGEKALQAAYKRLP